MNLFSVAIMSDVEIVQFWKETKTFANVINIEWNRRHNIDFPFLVMPDGIIMDCIDRNWVRDEEVESHVLEQAEIIREKWGLTR